MEKKMIVGACGLACDACILYTKGECKAVQR